MVLGDCPNFGEPKMEVLQNPGAPGSPSATGSISIEVNGEPREVPPGTTVADLLAELGVEPRHVAVELNLQVIPRARHHEQCIAAGDRVEVVTLVGGG